MGFPIQRMRRLRRNEAIRAMVRETQLLPEHLVQPLFVCPGTGVERPVASMPGCAQMSPDRAAAECRELYNLGIRSVILFGIPDHKDATGSGASDEHGVVPQSLRAIKEAVPGMLVWCDIFASTPTTATAAFSPARPSTTTPPSHVCRPWRSPARKPELTWLLLPT